METGGGTWQTGGSDKGDTLVCAVTPHDGEEAGDAVSDSVTVLNTAPTLSTVGVLPVEPQVNSTVTCTASGLTDADDDEVTAYISWTVDGVEIGTSTSLAGGFAKGDTLVCTATPHDGAEAGDAVSDSVTVFNTAPVPSAVELLPVEPQVDSTVTCTASGLTDADDDEVTAYISWTVDGVEIGTATPLTGGFA